MNPRPRIRHIALSGMVIFASAGAEAHRQPPPEEIAADNTEVNGETTDTQSTGKSKKTAQAADKKTGGGTDASKQANLESEANDPPLMEEPVSLDTIEIQGRETELVGIVESGSQGVVGQNQFKTRPLLRVGELVEVIPGMMATQHSGSGKANQYFLRGFNLDHGTDFATWVDGVPMNLPTNAHGQGYMDLNSIIPELVDRVEYGKGPYYAEMGDFASAGYSQMHTKHRLDQGIVKLTGGEFDYYRAVIADSNQVGPGDLLYGVTYTYYTGPWVQPQNLDSYNGMLRYTLDNKDWGASFIVNGYGSNWTATNQIPEALVQSKQLSLYGTMNNTDGGVTDRWTGSANVWSRGDGYKNEANFYAAYYSLRLFSDFTYYLNNPQLGDQIFQGEDRVYFGGNASQTWFNQLFGTEMDNTLGIQFRRDQIGDLELANSYRRNVYDVTATNNVWETSVSLYGKSENRWTDWFRTIAGLREDIFFFDVKTLQGVNSTGDMTASLASPKLSLVFGPWAETEFYLNGGYGFHSNDARGVMDRVDPSTQDYIWGVTPLSRTQGAEIGARTQYVPGLNSTLAFWFLHSDSELVFVGDEGTTEPTGPGNRYGVEFANYYKLTQEVTLDADFAFTQSKYTDLPSGENSIPQSIGNVITAGAVYEHPDGYYATARLRHFSNVPLNEANTVQLGTTTLVNIGGGYRFDNVKLELDLFNLFDSKANDIAYYYQYRLPDQGPDGVEGKVIHPVEPRMIRGTISINF